MWLFPAYVFVAACCAFAFISDDEDNEQPVAAKVMCAAIWPVLLTALLVMKFLRWARR
jgi:hypothetical protein